MQLIDVVVETPRGSRNKYEIDEHTGLVWLDRRLPGAFAFPADYGYVPGALGSDSAFDFVTPAKWLEDAERSAALVGRRGDELEVQRVRKVLEDRLSASVGDGLGHDHVLIDEACS